MGRGQNNQNRVRAPIPPVKWSNHAPKPPIPPVKWMNNSQSVQPQMNGMSQQNPLVKWSNHAPNPPVPPVKWGNDCRIAQPQMNGSRHLNRPPAPITPVRMPNMARSVQPQMTDTSSATESKPTDAPKEQQKPQTPQKQTEPKKTESPHAFIKQHGFPPWDKHLFEHKGIPSPAIPDRSATSPTPEYYPHPRPGVTSRAARRMETFYQGTRKQNLEGIQQKGLLMSHGGMGGVSTRQARSNPELTKQSQGKAYFGTSKMIADSYAEKFGGDGVTLKIMVSGQYAEDFMYRDSMQNPSRYNPRRPQAGSYYATKDIGPQNISVWSADQKGFMPLTKYNPQAHKVCEND